jgi:AAA15 family ATPase/GTPase
MIINFSISNFRSFNEEQTFSLAASGRVSSTHEDHVVPVPSRSERVLRTAILYGANGAGKSNLFAGLAYLKELALDTQAKSSGTGRVPFRLGIVESPEESTDFDLQFMVNNRVYRYGLKLDSSKILEEWLLEVKGTRERVLYERITNVDSKVSVEIAKLNKPSARLKALSEVGAPANQSFLATILALLEKDDIGTELLAILNWFQEDLVLIGPDEPYAPIGLSLFLDQEFRDFASDFIRGASTGVDVLEVIKQEVAESDLVKALPRDVFKRMYSQMEEQHAEGSGTVIGSGDGKEFLVERKDGLRFSRLVVEAIHKNRTGDAVRFALSEESDGTKRLLNLLPALYKLRDKDAVFFIDEIDRSLHPILVRKFLEFFLRSCSGKRHQLIITTHESTLLDLDLVRKDEIWFAEKDPRGATNLYSLDDYRVRTDLEIRKHYLQGRFGAVPFLGSLDALLGNSEVIDGDHKQ